MRVSLFRHWRDNAPTQIDLPFADFAAELGTDEVRPVADKRDTPAFSPVEFAPGKPRKDEFALAVHAAVFDFDGVDKQGETEAGVRALLEALQGDSFVLYSSFSHRDVAANDRYKFRAVIELSRPVLAVEWRGFWRRLGAMLPIAHDPSCVNEARIYGLPVMHSEHDFVQRFEGKPIDVEAVLALPDPQAVKRDRAPTVLEAKLDRKEVAKLASAWAKSSHADTAKRGRLVKAILNGDPYATGETGRHETARELTIFLEGAFPSTAPEAIASIFRASVVSMGADDPGWDIDQRLEDIERLIEGARDMRLDREAEIAAAYEAEAKAKIAAARADGKDTPYTVADLEQLAAAQGCAVADLDHRWIVCRGSGFYFLRQDGYTGPFSSTGFPAAARDHLAPAQLRLQRETDDEGLKLRAVPELIKDYGTEALKVVASMYAPTSSFDGVTLTEAVCRLRRLDDSYHPEFAKIDHYVELLANGHADKLRDWLATVTDLSRPTAALYFSGAAGSGKSLFMSAISRLYTTGAPSALRDALGSFNDTILNCPILVSDDSGLPSGVTSGDIREIIGVIARPLNRKYMPSAELQGAVRVIIGANREDVLDFNETLSSEELDATAQRIIHIVTTEESRQFLAVTPHRHWVTEDLFARYVLWLKKNRVVKAAWRWLVEGHMPEMRAKLATGGPNARFCEWIVNALSDECARIKNTAHAECVQIKDGQLFVNAQAPTHQWGAYVSETGRNDTPTPTKASMALKALGHDRKPIKAKVNGKSSTVQFWRVNLEYVWSWAAEVGLGDVAQMKAYVAGAKSAA